jgi:EmrB/QacA subfamily drug resistance transporter
MQPDETIVLSRHRRWAITAGVMTGMFLAALEATVVGTAMPTVIASLGGLEHYSWVFSAYLLTSTVTVPVWGKLSDIYGRRIIFQAAVVIFLIGSALSGLSKSMPQLILFRGLQGLGAGGLVPLAMTIIGDIYTLEERTRMQALFSGVWGLSSIVGPVIGGFLTDQLSWRWVFFLNLPFGIGSSIILGLALKEPRIRKKPEIDYIGAITLMLSIVLLMLVVVSGSELASLMTVRNLFLLFASIAFFIWFLYIERRAPDPVVPLSLFKNRVVAVAVTAGFFIGIAMFGAISFIPLFAQGTRGATATEAGTLLTPLLLSWVSLSVLGGRLLLRVGYKPTVITGTILLTAGFAILSTINRDTTQFWLYVDLILIGAGLGLTMLTLLIAVQQAVSRETLGTATSLNQFARSIGGALGIAVMGAVLSGGLAGSHMSANALMEPATRATIPPDVLNRMQQSLFVALQNVFRVAMIVSAVGLVIVFALPSQNKKDRRTQVPEKACEPECCERMMMAEIATLRAENEPVAGD